MTEQNEVKKQSSLKVNFILNAILTISGFLFPLISFPYVSMVSNLIMVRMRDSNYLAASGTLSSYTNMIISPLAAIAAILVVAAVARYGISESGSPQDFADQNMFNG